MNEENKFLNNTGVKTLATKARASMEDLIQKKIDANNLVDTHAALFYTEPVMKGGSITTDKIYRPGDDKKTKVPYNEVWDLLNAGKEVILRADIYAQTPQGIIPAGIGSFLSAGPYSIQGNGNIAFTTQAYLPDFVIFPGKVPPPKQGEIPSNSFCLILAFFYQVDSSVKVMIEPASSEFKFVESKTPPEVGTTSNIITFVTG